MKESLTFFSFLFFWLIFFSIFKTNSFRIYFARCFRFEEFNFCQNLKNVPEKKMKKIFFKIRISVCFVLKRKFRSDYIHPKKHVLTNEQIKNPVSRKEGDASVNIVAEMTTEKFAPGFLIATNKHLLPIKKNDNFFEFEFYWPTKKKWFELNWNEMNFTEMKMRWKLNKFQTDKQTTTKACQHSFYKIDVFFSLR